MAYDVYTVSGVVLDVWNHKEWDKKFLFFSKEYGIINITAIGTQRPKSKMRGFINRFCFIEIDIVHGKTGYRLIRARSNMGGFLIHKKESYFILSRISKLFIGLLPDNVPHYDSFLLFVHLGKYLENNLILKDNSNKIFYETALRLLAILGYYRLGDSVFDLSKFNEFNLKINESSLVKEYENILTENGLANMI
jgi:recombinational DNA repair protein (RecF pathway)